MSFKTEPELDSKVEIWSTDSNDEGAIKSGSIIAPRGSRFSRILRGEKPRTLKPNGAPRFIRNRTLHLPTVEWEVSLWKWRSCQLCAAEMFYLLTASPAEGGIWSALLVPPSLPPSDRHPLQILVRFQFHASSEQVSCQSCLSFTLFPILFPSQTPKTWSLIVMSMFCALVQCNGSYI